MLAAFPSSGTTWLKNMIEAATGIFAGNSIDSSPGIFSIVDMRTDDSYNIS